MKPFCEHDRKCPGCVGGRARPLDPELVPLGSIATIPMVMVRCNQCKGRGMVCDADSAVEGCGAFAAYCTGAPSPTGSTPTSHPAQPPTDRSSAPR